MQRHPYPTRRRQTGALLAAGAYGLVAAISVALAYVLAAWLDCSTSESVALCLAPAALPGSLLQPLRRLALRWLCWRLHRAQARVVRCKLQALRCAGRQLDAEDALQQLRRQIHHAAGVHHG